MLPLDPTPTAHLFPPLLDELLRVLRGLSADEWGRATVARRWRVREVAAHLLDGDLQRLAASRDGYRASGGRPLKRYEDVLAAINEANESGVRYAERLSTRLVVDLLAVTGPWVSELVASLPPYGEATYAVAWAGEERSANWMDVGREFTERWHHQMQIRDAVGAPGLLEERWMLPLLDLSVRCLPRAYASIRAPEGAAVSLTVPGLDRGAWSVVRAPEGWRVGRGSLPDAATRITADADVVWRIFYNALAPADAATRVTIEGDRRLAEPLLRARSVMV